MLKVVLGIVLKRYWGFVASILMISAFSQYRHEHQVSLRTLFLSLLAGPLALFITAFPLELTNCARVADNTILCRVGMRAPGRGPFSASVATTMYGVCEAAFHFR
jgi:hypothetical protein